MTEPRIIHKMVFTLAAPVIWAAHFVTVYTLVSLACALGEAVAAFLLWAFTLLASGAVGLTVWRYGREMRRVTHAGKAGQAEFSVPLSPAFNLKMGLVLAVLSLIAIVWAALPMLFVGPCH